MSKVLETRQKISDLLTQIGPSGDSEKFGEIFDLIAALTDAEREQLCPRGGIGPMTKQ